MKFSIVISPLILAIMLVMVSAPACAIKITAGTSDGSVVASASGEYRLQDSTRLKSEIALGEGVVSRQSSASGSGKNEIIELVSGSGSSITNTIASDGSFRSTSSDSASGAGAVSDYQTSLTGSSGSIGTISTGKGNQMTVAGGFSGQGNMEASLTSLAAQEALTTGTATALGTPIISDELIQGIKGQDMMVSVQGLYRAGKNEELGEFGIVAQNAKGNAAAKPQPTEGPYKLTGWRWRTVQGANSVGTYIPIIVYSQNSPTDAAAQIAAATQTWDGQSHETLFSGVTPQDSGSFNKDLSKWDIRDTQNVHIWTKDTGLTANTIAMTVTWSGRVKTILGDDLVRYSEAIESDCWYNSNNFNWYTDGGLSRGSLDMDVQTIALHELGHTLGLADLYNSANQYQTMYGYSSGGVDRTLNSGDITGLQKLYGK
jgi:hypothetical protein